MPGDHRRKTVRLAAEDSEGYRNAGVSPLGIDEDGDWLLFKKSSHFHRLRVRVAGKSMHRKICRLLFFLLDLLLILLDLLLDIFNGFNQ
ncbi:hypothetical protein GW17_00052681 [Ensete ventricosum]|nr:hypothetical protein GW17_00052681 [Ensete ventricosum]